MGNGGDDATRKIILARRARFLAAALASVSAGTAVVAATDACGGTVDEQQTDGGEPQPCLSPQQPDAQPQPCLSKIADDAGSDAGKDAAFDADAEPQPCLAPPPGDDGG